MYCAYHYRPLQHDEIRLIELLPGDVSGDICIRIVYEPFLWPLVNDTRLSREEVQRTLPDPWHVYQTPEGRYFFSQGPDYQRAHYEHPDPSIKAALYAGTPVQCYEPAFEALSYVWGEPGGENVVYVEDGSNDSWTTLPIWQNLTQALRSLRCTERAQRLWVDAICINQEDLDERAEQVKRMGLIYGQATRVIVWLGLSSDNSKLAFEVLHNLGRLVEMSGSEKRLFDAPDAEEEWWVNQGMSSPQIRALEGLFSRSWFQRLWVIQEIALANASALLMCGEDEIQYYYSRRAVACLSSSPGDDLHELLRGPASICWGIDDATTTGLLLMSRRQQCADPRDKIYGILSLIGPRLAENVQPSYTSSSIQVYKEFLLRCGESTGRLDLFTSCQNSGDDTGDSTPSWIPDWRSQPKNRLFLVPGFQASGISKAVFDEPEAGVLRVQGIVCGAVKKALPPDPAVDIVTRLMQTRPKDETAQYPGGGTNLSAWLRALSLDYFEERFPDSVSPAQESWNRYILSVADGKTTPEDFTDASPYIRSTYHEMKDTLNQASFIHLDTGYFGFTVGQGPREGDCVCVILGCWLPLLLRPVSLSSDKFKILGLCFLPGLMDSEALLGNLPASWRVQQQSESGSYRPQFVNTETGEMQVDDPRMPCLSSDWTRTDVKRTKDDPIFADYFEHRPSGSVQNWDPRLSVDALKSRGVSVGTLLLV